VSDSDELGVLVVDDMALYRKVLADAVGAISGARVVGTAFDGRAALDRIERLRPDLVLLDVEMPNLNGLETLERIRARWPEVGVVMVSGTSRGAADITLRALEKGALDFIPKPATRGPEESRAQLVESLAPVLRAFRTRTALRRARARQAAAGSPGTPAPRPPAAALASSRLATRGVGTPGGVARPTLWPTGTPGAAAPGFTGRPTLRPMGDISPVAPARAAVPGEFALVAVGVSTGGPQALAMVVPALPGDLLAPILIVQHMPPGFTASLAAQLDSRSALAVREAEEGLPLLPGTVTIARGGSHTIVRARHGALTVGLSDAPPVKSCRPSVDVMLRSLAGAVPGRILTLIMTGMGDDGADGVQALTRHGSYNLAQDEASCVVFGMPRAVAERRHAHEVLSLGRLASRLEELVTTASAPRRRALGAVGDPGEGPRATAARTVAR
jgi:two-component system chemotaxis response regulator CheB